MFYCLYFNQIFIISSKVKMQRAKITITRISNLYLSHSFLMDKRTDQLKSSMLCQPFFKCHNYCTLVIIVSELFSVVSSSFLFAQDLDPLLSWLEKKHEKKLYLKATSTLQSVIMFVHRLECIFANSHFISFYLCLFLNICISFFLSFCFYNAPLASKVSTNGKEN